MPAKKGKKGAVAGFSDEGRRYVVSDVHFLESADSFLFNDSMFLQIDHRGRCRSWFLQPNATRYSEELRCVWVRDEETQEFWSAPWDPVQAEPEEFEFAPGLGDISWRNVTRGIEVRMRLVVPPDDTVELWTIEARNVSKRRRRISIYPFFPIGFLADLYGSCRFDEKLGGVIYDYFPYYVEVADYYRNAKLKNIVFCVGDRKPTSYEADMDAFRGGGLLHNPHQLKTAKLGGGHAEFGDGGAVFQYRLGLAAGKSAAVNILFGPAGSRAEIEELRATYLSKGGVKKAVAAVEEFRQAHEPVVTVETPDEEFNSYVNYWLPRQALWIGRTLRSGLCPCARNAIQDSMGITYNDPERARHWYLGIWRHQERNGWMPHGLPMAEGVRPAPINTIPHRDMNAWGPPALYMYVTETGDMAILDEQVGFPDGGEGTSLYEHICLGLDWMLADRTLRGLSHIGEGDWCDPLNMAGHELRGESVMLTENLAYALALWARVSRRRGDSARAERYAAEASDCRRAINSNAWDENWYIRGTTDAGEAFGSAANREGRIWLNPQSWAIICGAAEGERMEACLASVEKHLSSPSGPITNWPPYRGMRETIGKITLKNAGVEEHAAVYNHSAVWLALAYLVADKVDRGWKVLRTILTGTKGNTIARSGQLPLYVPNYYRGPSVGESAGQSSHRPGTGTVAWFYRVAVGHLLGVTAEFDGLRIDPRLPMKWKRAKVVRRFRGAQYDIEIKRSRQVEGIEVFLDGEKMEENFVPLQEEGSRHEVSVAIPS